MTLAPACFAVALASLSATVFVSAFVGITDALTFSRRKPGVSLLSDMNPAPSILGSSCHVFGRFIRILYFWLSYTTKLVAPRVVGPDFASAAPLSDGPA